jgi:hypothetical protein
LEELSEAKGISPTFSKSKVKRIGLFQKFGKTKQSEVNLLKFLPRSKQNEYNCSSTIEDLPLLFQALRNMIRVVHPGSWFFLPTRIPETSGKKRHRIRTLVIKSYFDIGDNDWKKIHWNFSYSKYLHFNSAQDQTTLRPKVMDKLPVPAYALKNLCYKKTSQFEKKTSRPDSNRTLHLQWTAFTTIGTIFSTLNMKGKTHENITIENT